MRLLGAVRLSNLTDESTSPERQRDQLTYTALARHDTLVHITEDLDVSGAVPAFDRDQLGPWLTDPDKIKQWDGLIVAKLDRLTRSLLDFQNIKQWADENKKTIISVSEGFDLSTPVGKLIANILVMFAEFERERIGERRKEAYVKLQNQGYWQGGKVHYGYQRIKVNDHWELMLDPQTADTINWMSDRILEGRSRNWLARELNERGCATPDGAVQWTGLMVGRLLTDPVINGKIVADGKLILGKDGMPLTRPAVIDDDKWVRLQASLRKTTQSATTRYDTSMLTSIVYCECSKPMYAKRQTSKGKLYEYYSCYGKCGTPRIRMEKLHKATDYAMTHQFGSVKITETIIHPGDDHGQLTAKVGQQIADLTTERFVRKIIRPDYDTLMTQLQAEHARLSALPAEPDRIEKRPTGMTVKQVWPNLDDHTKRRFLLDHKVTMTVTQPGTNGPADIKWRIADYEGFLEGLTTM